MSQDCFHDIERDLVAHYRTLDPYDQVAIEQWYRLVAGWILDLPDDAVKSRVMLAVLLEMVQTNGNLPLPLCSMFLNYYIELEREERRL